MKRHGHGKKMESSDQGIKGTRSTAWGGAGGGEGLVVGGSLGHDVDSSAKNQKPAGPLVAIHIEVSCG